MNSYRLVESGSRQRLSGWLVCVCSAVNFLQTEYEIKRTKSQDAQYTRMSELIDALSRSLPPVPPVPVANEGIPTDQLFVGLDAYLRSIGFPVAKQHHPSVVLRGLLSRSFSDMGHADASGPHLIRALLVIAQMIERETVVASSPNGRQISRFVSEKAKQRLSRIFWEGIVAPLLPRIRASHQRLVEAAVVAPLVDKMIAGAIMQQRATHVAPQFIN